MGSRTIHKTVPRRHGSPTSSLNGTPNDYKFLRGSCQRIKGEGEPCRALTSVSCIGLVLLVSGVNRLLSAFMMLKSTRANIVSGEGRSR